MGVVQLWLMPQMLPCKYPLEWTNHGTVNDSPKLNRFVKILVIEIFSSVLGLFGLIIGLLVSSNANDFSGSSTG